MRLCRIVCVYRMEDLNVARHMYVAGQAQERKTVRVGCHINPRSDMPPAVHAAILMVLVVVLAGAPAPHAPAYAAACGRARLRCIKTGGSHHSPFTHVLGGCLACLHLSPCACMCPDAPLCPLPLLQLLRCVAVLPPPPRCARATTAMCRRPVLAHSAVRACACD